MEQLRLTITVYVGPTVFNLSLLYVRFSRVGSHILTCQLFACSQSGLCEKKKNDGLTFGLAVSSSLR